MSDKNEKSENDKMSGKEKTSEKNEASERDVTSGNPTSLSVNQKVFKESEAKESVNIKEHKEPTEELNDATSESKVSQDETSDVFEKVPSSTSTTYETLGEQIKELTEKMELVTQEMKEGDQEIPFMDDAGESEDYTSVPRKSNGSEEDLSMALSSLSLSPLLQVEKIQLEPSDPTSTLVTGQRSLQGRDTIRGGDRGEVRREYTDI